MEAKIEVRKPESQKLVDSGIFVTITDQLNMEADTAGKRIYLIRLALGDGLRSPMPMAEFAALVSRRSGGSYDSSTISKIENGTRRVTLDDVRLIAPLDPQKRGRSWLAWGEDEAERVAEPPLTTKEIADFVNEELAASRVYDAERATPPAADPAPAAARKAAGGTRGRSRGR